MPEEAPVVLVVEDGSIRNLLCDALERHGLKGLPASNGEQAVELARKHRPDFILTDLCLERGPGGEEVLRIIKGDPLTRKIPVIVYSSVERTLEFETRLALAGADFFFTRDEVFENGDYHPLIIRRIKTLVALRSASLSASSERQAVRMGPYERRVRTRTVLVIDAERSAAEIVRTFLSEEPCRVVYAESGVKSLRLAGFEQPDLVVMGTRLADLDGSDLLDRLRSNAKKSFVQFPILVLADDASREAEFLRLGADDYLLKTASREVFKTKVLSLQTLISLDSISTSESV